MTKALHVCRHLRAAGWRVVLVETYKYWHVGARLSNSVDVFARVPIPELYPDNYKQAIGGEQACAVDVKSACGFCCCRLLHTIPSCSDRHAAEQVNCMVNTHWALADPCMSLIAAGEAEAVCFVCLPADIAQREGASLFIPVSSPIASLYDALAGEALPKGCR